MIKTFEEALQFVIDHRICTIFGSKGSPHPSLWDNTTLSENKPEAGGWSPKVMAVWDWKTRIPQTYPELVYYGKIKGGDAVLMEMQYFREMHYPAAFQPVSVLDKLAQQIYEFIRSEPAFTGPLRKRAIEQLGCTKSQFDTAIKKLQISLNIVRANDPSLKNDFWLTMREVHMELVNQNENNSSNEPAEARQIDH
ncbi:AlkZ-related protein [Planctomycetaceae bacterium SH139]